MDLTGSSSSSAVLPPGWAATTLADVTTQAISMDGPGDGDEFLYVDISSIDNWAKRITEPKTLPKFQAPSRARQRLMSGDVVVSMTRPNLNAVALVPESMADAVGSTGFHVLRAIASVPQFLYYLVQSQTFVDAMSELVQGALYPAVRPKDISGFGFALPPLTEQHRIVAEIERQFSLLDAGVANLRRVQANLRRYRASVLQDACTGRLVPTEAELAQAEGREYEPADHLLDRILAERRVRWEADQLAKMEARGTLPMNGAWKAKYEEPSGPDTVGLPELPEGWTWASVEQLGWHGDAVLTGPFGTSMGTEDFITSGVPVLTIGCLTVGGVELEKARFVSERKAAALGRYALRIGDMLFSRMASVGRAGVVGAALEGALFNYHIMRLRLNPEVLIPAFYLAYVRGAKVVTDYVVKVNHGATRDGINTEQLLQMPVVLPPLAEQERIVAEVERRLSVVDELEKVVAANLKRADRLRQAILKDAFAGRLVPQDPKDEPASVLLERIKAERAAAQDKPKTTRKVAAPKHETPSLFS